MEEKKLKKKSLNLIKSSKVSGNEIIMQNLSVFLYKCNNNEKI